MPEDRDEMFFEAFSQEFANIDLISKARNLSVLVDFALNMRSSHYVYGQKIFQTGDKASEFYVIRKGGVRICFEGLSELPLIVIPEGSYFGESDLMMKDEE